MGWLWASKSDGSSAKEKLDPSLREFLEKEGPSGPKPALPSKSTTKASEPLNPTQDASNRAPESPAVPPQSQFQDGRYSHLWKNYTPQQALEDRAKTEQDRLRDIVDAYNDRSAEIGRVAMENCAFEYMEQFECFKNPTWMEATTVCRTQTRKFSKCYDMQVKFLKALGYLTMDTRSPEEYERIQMHADKLYQQLKEQEAQIEKAQIEKAQEEGEPIPTFDSPSSKENAGRAMAEKSVVSKSTFKPSQQEEDHLWSQIKPSSRQEYEKKINELPPEDRELEKSVILAELRAQAGMAQKVEGTLSEERINRMKRREAGQATLGDTIKRLWGWD